MRYVIVGNGPAGFTAACTIRSLDARADVTVVSDEPHPFYSRVLTSYFIAGRVSREALFLAGAGDYGARGITLLGSRRAVGVRAGGEGGGELELDDGSRLKWDRLLLATGSDPVRLEVPGADLPGVFYLRGLGDAEAIAAYARPGDTALVIGGGMIGFKAAEGLLGRGMRVTMVVSSPYVLSQALDEEAGHLVGEMLARHGVTVLTGTDVLGFSARGDYLVAELSGGQSVTCRLAVVGKGVRPRTGLARALGLRVERGIVCDDYMATSLPGVFAAGDVAQVYDPARSEARVNAIWPNAVAQGRVAGANMVRGVWQRFWGGIGRNALLVGDIAIISGGLVAPRGDGYQEIRVRGPGFYRKLVMEGERAVGAVFVGDLTGAGVVMALVQSGQPAPHLPGAFRSGRLHAAYVRMRSFAHR
jgi:NAD(P)H-nitrite reductase large subunit